ncbi:MAG: hypothetical protein SH818_02100 [Saprospiraceae bacterium]|nr:hypothetical protein [Saprospiraceae bacterium]
MKNKLLIPIAFVILGLQVPLLAQSPEPATEPAKKDQLEQRLQNSTEKPAPAIREKANRQARSHAGGKQNFRDHTFQRRNFGQPGYRFHRFNGRGYNPGRFGNNFQRHSFRSHQFRSNSFRQEQFRSRGFNQRGYNNQGLQTRRFRSAPGQLNKNQQMEIKSLKEQIWKDGSMDLKERELLRNKTKGFHRSNHPALRERTGEQKK